MKDPVGVVPDRAHITALATELVTDFPPERTAEADFLGAQFDRGLAWVNHPVGLGGLGADVALQSVVDHVVDSAGGPSASAVNPIGHGMCAPTVLTWGTPEQQARLLRPLFTGEEIWCQLFSEPGAGSDVAGLATRAVNGGYGWTVNGQKVWTTMAHRARWGLLLARSDPQAAKHQGMTAFVLDMQAPGIEVRPLYQMTGEAEFNEVFFDGVQVEGDQVLGGVGNGWRVAVTTLMNERVSIGGVVPRRGEGPIAHLLEAFGDLQAADDCGAHLYADTVVALWIRAELNRLSNVRMSQRRRPGEPGPEGSIGKILSAELNKDIYSAQLNLMGADGMSYGSYERVRPVNAHEYGSPQKAFLRSRANSIEGGATEVMRNILAERLLGLPGEPRADKGVPWIDIPRS